MKITSAESVIMEALWREAPQSAEQVIANVAEPQSWTARTVRTLLTRLLNRGAVTIDLEGRRFLYRPVVSRADYLATESGNLLDRLFDGRISPLIVHFADQGKFTPEDLATIKKLIEDLDGNL